MIRRQGSKWVVLTKDGKKVLGRHETEEKAQAQLAAIEASKKRRAKGGRKQSS